MRKTFTLLKPGKLFARESVVSEEKSLLSPLAELAEDVEKFNY
jgi:hypothetical protein